MNKVRCAKQSIQVIGREMVAATWFGASGSAKRRLRGWETADDLQNSVEAGNQGINRVNDSNTTFFLEGGKQMYQQQQQNDQVGMRGGFNLVTGLLQGHAMTCTVFTRTDFGKEGIGFAGMFGFFIMLVYGGLMNSYAMFIYLCLYLLMVLAQRMKQFSNWRKGIIVHSRYVGYPWLAFRLFPRIKSEANAKGAEAFLCLAVGGLLAAYVDQPLGWWVMFAWVSILATESMIVEVQRRRLQAMRDAEIEQRSLANAYREGRF